VLFQVRKSDDWRAKMPDVEKTFGEAFGDLIRKKRGQEGLTQKELAIKAFDDESKVRRIIFATYWMKRLALMERSKAV
jgi:ribosome-binding protein aMBF1 (putative translation factor)